MKIPIEERKEYWKWFHARQCFYCAKIQLEELIEFRKIKMEGKNIWKFQNMLTAFFGNYGKPFKKNNNVGKLSEEIIPDNLLLLHKQMITYRDKLFLHGDLNGKLEEVNEFMEKVTLVKNNSKFHWELSQLLPSPERLKEYLEIVDELVTKSKYYVDKFNNKWKFISLLPNGKYELNIRNENGDPLIKTE
jgi:hypothetical protein